MSAARKAQEVSDTIASLQDHNIDRLRRVWRERYGAPPQLRSGDLMRRCLAEKVQMDAFGGDAEVDARLLCLVRAYQRTGKAPMPQTTLRPGSVLLREYNGRPHRVEVLDKGFRWNGKVWRSLSEIAREITGTRWNGPAFFGLRDKKAAR